MEGLIVEIAPLGYYTSGDTWDGVQPYVEEMGVLYVQDIIVTDGTGKVVADSRRYIIDDDPESYAPTRSAELNHAGRRIGVVYVDAEPAIDAAFADALATAFNRSVLWGSTVAGIVALALTWYLSRAMAAPISALAAAAERAGGGDLTPELESTGIIELDAVVRPFNKMLSDLRQAEAQMRNLVNDAAHELRTPLTNIIGYLEAVKDGLVDTESGFATIEEEARLLAKLVYDLQSVALGDSEHAYLTIEETDVCRVVSRAVDGILPIARAKGLVVAARCGENDPPFRMDAFRIGQVLTNLLRNAVNYTEPGGEVTVTAVRDHVGLLLTVVDTGRGIAAEHLPHLFERFYRVDPSRSRTTGGRGIGLSIARQLVEAHGGSLSVESKLGVGSRFIVRLPVSIDSAKP